MIEAVTNRAQLEIIQKIIIPTRGPKVKFTGRIIASMEFDAPNGKYVRLEIWETQGRSLVPVSIEADETRVDVIAPATEAAMRFAVMDFFDWRPEATAMVEEQLKWRLYLEVP